MITQMSKFSTVSILIAGLAAVLFSSVALTIVPATTWRAGPLPGTPAAAVPAYAGAAAPLADSQADAGEARAKDRCRECGVVESMRALASMEASAGHEITVRLLDGSTRVLSDAGFASWRLGERIIVIGGPDLARR